jgi:predicted transglutaminase-like cysteine proteinase
MRNAPWTVWRKRDLAYQILIHALAVVGMAALFVWATEARGQDRVLIEVNDRVNASIRYVRQSDGMESARVLPTEGDCDDYVWSKMMLLAREGVAMQRMAPTPVRYRGQEHVVLVVDDAWVLDNIERRVVPVETARRYYAF